ncbi:MAG TPA: PDZ domain-containing protein [Acidobacteriaceae bacterium]|nr:PDZ domain-containing protein [Acidobacteriaceae bacterium]
MKYLPVAVVAACCMSLPLVVFGQQDLLGGSFPAEGEQHVTMPEPDAAVLSPSQGYLGVGMRDVDTERAGQLKLKEARGVEITTIDHDAPAGKAGLKIHDVILGMNGQAIVGQAQLTRMLHDTPAGHTVNLLISRDGQQVTISVQLADRATIEADAWSQHIPVPDPDDDLALPAGTGSSFGNGIFSSLTSNPFYTGLDLDSLGPQLANFFGVHDGQGLLVRRVDDDSPAAQAGLRAGDVITRLNGQRVATMNQWDHAIHANRGKPVQLTVIRDKHEGTLSMMAGRARNKS